jgi:adenylosuccinate lyase
MVLLKLVERGMSREKAYAVVQRSAMESWTKDLDFRGLLEADGEVTSFLTAADLDAVFRVENFLGQIDFIYERVFGERS